MLRSHITGVGSYLPPNVVTNHDLSQRMDTSHEWIVGRTGIEARRWVDPDTTTSDLALEAASAAIASSGIDKSDIDLIVFATLSPDHEFPGTGCFLQAKMDLGGIPALDVRQQCTGFVYGASIADQFIRTGMYDTVLVVGAEVHSKGLDVSTDGRDVAVLFGDGAGAVVMQATDVADADSGPQVFSTHLHADGNFAQELWVEAPGMAYSGERLTPDILERGEHYPKMNGRAVYVNAVKRMSEAVLEALDANDMKIDEVDLFLFHQANLRINEAVAERLHIQPQRVFNTIAHYGNTTAATIPIGMDEAVKAGALQPGMTVMCAAFGSGFTWGSMLLRW